MEVTAQTLPAHKIQLSKETLLDARSDIDWLYETHLKGMSKKGVKSALLEGSEDAPTQVWVSNDSKPKLDSIFRRVL